MTLTVAPEVIVSRAEASGRPGLLARHPSWPRVPLGSLLRIVNGAPFSSRLFNKEARGIPLVRIRDVGGPAPTTFYDGPFDEQMLLRPGDLIVGMDGDFRVAAWRGPAALMNQRVCRLDLASDSVERGWLLHCLPGYLDAIWAETSSVTVKHLSSKSIAKIPLPLPPIEEQRRIVGLLEWHLSRLEAAETLLANSVERLARMAGSWLAFQPTLSQAERRPLRSLLASPLRHGRSVPTADNGFPVLRLTALSGPRVNLAERKIGAWDGEQASPFLVARGDFLVARGSGSLHLVGRGSFIDEDPDPVAYPDTAIRVRLSTDHMTPAFLSLIWGSRVVRAQIEALAKTTAGIHKINQADLARVEVPVPALKEQRDLVRSAGEFEVAVLRLQEAVKAAQIRGSALRRSLMSSAFSGRFTEDATESEGANV